MDEITEGLNRALATGGEHVGLEFLRTTAFALSCEVELVVAPCRIEPVGHVADALALLELGEQLCTAATAYLEVAEGISGIELL